MSDPASLRAVFVGAVDFSHHCLERLLAEGANIVAVLTPFPEQARNNTDYADLAPVAQRHGVALKRFRRINDPETVAELRAASPDVIFVFGLSQLLGPEVLGLPRLGVIGVHPTLLPEGRGRHPLIWALAKGLTKSGLSFFYMDDGPDTGDILWQKPFAIGPDDTAADLYEVIKALASEAIAEFLPKLAAGAAPRRPQDHSQATVWPRRGEKDGEIDWARPAGEIHNLIRALSRPYVGAHTFLDTERVICWRSRCATGASVASPNPVPPGTVIQQEADALKVATGDGMIEVLDWQPRGLPALKERVRLGRASS